MQSLSPRGLATLSYARPNTVVFSNASPSPRPGFFDKFPFFSRRWRIGDSASSILPCPSDRPKIPPSQSPSPSLNRVSPESWPSSFHSYARPYQRSFFFPFGHLLLPTKAHPRFISCKESFQSSEGLFRVSGGVGGGWFCFVFFFLSPTPKARFFRHVSRQSSVVWNPHSPCVGRLWPK